MQEEKNVQEEIKEEVKEETAQASSEEVAKEDANVEETENVEYIVLSIFNIFQKI